MRAFRLLVISVVALGVLGFGPAVASGQGTGVKRPAPVPVDSGTVEVRLVDGSTLYGTVESEIEGVVRLILMSGDVIELRRERIQYARPLVGSVVSGEVWRPDPNATRLFFGPTGRSLAQGAGYVSVYELVAPFVALGVTDRVTLAAGTPLFFGTGGERPFWFAPKVQVIRDERLNVSAGVLHFLMVGGESYDDCLSCHQDPTNFGVAYAVGTLGDSNAAVTAGAGVGYSGTDFADNAVLMLGGEARTSRSIKLLTENYLFAGEDFALLSGGLRFFGEKLTADLGLAIPVAADMDGFFAFPLVSFVYNW